MQPNLLPTITLFRQRPQARQIPYFLTPEKIQYISLMLGTFMHENRPFLRTGYTIRDLGHEMGIPAYQLSAFINQRLGMNFNEYFNWFRVQHCQLLMDRGDTERLNLRGLAYRCGFSNRNTLTTAFKKFTGRTPSAYFKRTP